jgi:AcrR family transcriptional regulator
MRGGILPTDDPRGAKAEPIEPLDPVREQKRARILRAALEICAREGAATTRMEQIAQRARVSKGTLYRFFESREELLLAALLDSYPQSLRRVASGAGPEPDPRVRLTRVCEALAGALAELAAHARVHFQVWGIVAGSPGFEERLLRSLRALHAERRAEFEALVRAGQAAGVFRASVSPAVVADALDSLLAGFVYRAAFDPRAASPDALRACLDALVIGALMGPSAQRSPETSGRL